MMTQPRTGPLVAFVLCLAAFLSLAWADGSRAVPPAPSGNPKVLILIGPHYGLPMREALIQPMMKTLTDGRVSLNDIFVEFLDLHRHDDPQYRSVVLTLLRHKLADSRSGLIIACNQTAVDFVIREGADLLPEAPMLIPILEKQPDWRDVSRKLIILNSRQDAQGTLRLALDLFPDTRRAVLIMGKDDRGAPFLEPLYQALEALPDRLEIETTAHLPYDDMPELVANLPEGTIGFYGSYFEDVTGRSFVPAEVASRVAEKAGIPVFAFRDLHIAQGLTGGSVVVTSELGRQAGRIALDYLQGCLPLPHPVTSFDVPHLPVFHWQALQCWGADVRRLPENTIYLNRPPSLWETYKQTVLMGLVGIAILLLLLIALIAVNRRQKTALGALQANHEKLQKILEVETVGVMFWDLSTGIMTNANDTFLKMMGYSREDVESRALTWQRLTPPEFFEVSLAEVRKFHATGRVGPYEKEYLRKDGKRQWMVFAGSSLDENTCVEFCVDISDRKKVEATLHETNQRLAAFLRISQDVSSSLERHVVMQSLVDNAVQAMNLGSGAIYLREGEFIRATAATPALPMTLPEQYRRAWLCDHPHIARTLDTDAPVIISDTTTATLSPQEQKIVELLNLRSILYLPIHLGNRPIGVLILSNVTEARTFHEEEIILLQGFADQAAQIMDNIRLYEEVQSHAVQLEHEVARRKQVEEELRLLNQELEERVQQRTLELEEANKQLEAFSYSVSHDLRAPLRGLTGLTRILLEKHAAGLSEDGKKLCTMIRDNAVTMGLLIDDLLTFSRAGRKAMHVSSIDMTGVVHGIIEELSSTEDTARVNFQVQDLPPAEADPSLIRHVWQNLLANAIKFSSKNERPEVQISAERQEDGRTVYHVRDNGAGFDMKYVDKIFRVFSRLHSSREFEGTGVGLAIVQQIVSRHDGRVWAAGEPGKGATFSFTLDAVGTDEINPSIRRNHA